MFIKLLGVGMVAITMVHGKFVSQVGASPNEFREAVVADPMTQPDPRSPQMMEKAGLNRALPAMMFDNLPLTEAVDRLRDATHKNIFVNWKTLDDVGVVRSKRVTLGIVEGLSLHAALDLLMTVAADGKRTIGWTTDEDSAKGERLVVVSTDVDVMGLFTRVYDIRDLLPTAKDARAARVDAMIRLVTDTIDPSSWKSHHGQVGVIREVSGSLIISQNLENHGRITAMLQQLRATFGNEAGAPKLTPPPATMSPDLGKK